MKSRFYSLIIGLSILLCLCIAASVSSEEPAEPGGEETGAAAASSGDTESIAELKEMLREIASQNAALKEDFAAFKTKVDMDIGEIKLVIDKKNQGLEDKMENLESRQEDIANKALMNDVVSPAQEEEKVGRETRNETAAEEPSSETEGVTSDSKVLNDNAVKEFLDEYYVDVELAVEDIKEEPVEEKAEEELPAEEPAEEKAEEPEQQEQEKEKAEEVAEYVDKNLEEKKPHEDKYAKDIQRAMKELHKAQKLFYSKRYNAALKKVGKSLAYHETALAYALEGSILVTIGNRESAVEAWETALELDPDLEDVEEALNKYKRR